MGGPKPGFGDFGPQPAPPPPPPVSARRSTKAGRAAGTTCRGTCARDLMRRGRQGHTGVGGAGIGAKPAIFNPKRMRFGNDAESVPGGGHEGGGSRLRGGGHPVLDSAKHANGNGEPTIPGCRGREVGLPTRAMSSLSAKGFG